MKFQYEFKNFPAVGADTKSNRVDGVVECELVRIQAGGSGAPYRVTWRVNAVSIASQDASRLSLDIDADQALKRRFIRWFQARYGQLVAERFYVASNAAQKRESTNESL